LILRYYNAKIKFYDYLWHKINQKLYFNCYTFPSERLTAYQAGLLAQYHFTTCPFPELRPSGFLKECRVHPHHRSGGCSGISPLSLFSSKRTPVYNMSVPKNTDV